MFESGFDIEQYAIIHSWNVFNQSDALPTELTGRSGEDGDKRIT